MASKVFKFGIHEFLNAQPLLIPLREREQDLGIHLVTAPPAELAEQLKRGELDMAFIPAIEYLRDSTLYRLIPGVSISSRGPVSSVLFASKKPLAEVQSIALDTRSRTSAALLQILYGDVFPWNVFMEAVEPNPKAMLEKHDAALVIGDPAFSLAEAHPNLTIYDLSEQWYAQTKKMFVHAVVAVRDEVELTQGFSVGIQDAKVNGLSRLEEIAQSKAAGVGIEQDQCIDYLSNKIIYELSKEEMNGLQHFRNICFDRGVLDQKEMIRFVRF